jgi:hypothetical protein
MISFVFGIFVFCFWRVVFYSFKYGWQKKNLTSELFFLLCNVAQSVFGYET